MEVITDFNNLSVSDKISILEKAIASKYTKEFAVARLQAKLDELKSQVKEEEGERKPMLVVDEGAKGEGKPFENPEVIEWTDTIFALKGLIEEGDATEEEIQEWKDTIETLEGLIEEENQNK